MHGGVSTWMHSYIEAMKEHEFVLWVIGAKAEDRGSVRIGTLIWPVLDLN